MARDSVRSLVQREDLDDQRKDLNESKAGGHASESKTNRLSKAEPAAKNGKGWA